MKKLLVNLLIKILEFLASEKAKSMERELLNQMEKDLKPRLDKLYSDYLTKRLKELEGRRL